MSFFKNLFGKKQEQEEEKVEKVEEAVLDVPSEDPFPSEWGSFSTYIDDKLASIRLNLALADEAPYPLYAYAMGRRVFHLVMSLRS